MSTAPKDPSFTPLGEISQGPSAFETFLDKNQKNLIILGVLIALGVAAYVIYDGIRQSKEENAGAELVGADDADALAKLSTDYPGSRAAATSSILLADKQWADGKQDEAISTLRSFISGDPKHPGLPFAKASLGSRLMSQGKSDEAATLFQELADDAKARAVAPYALICLGDIATAAGDATRAESFYKRVESDYADGPLFANTASSRIAVLRAQMPREIDPPPAPASPGDADSTSGTPASFTTPLAPPPDSPAAPEAPAADPAPEPAPADPASAPAHENP